MKTINEILDQIECESEVLGKSDLTGGNVYDVILYRKDKHKKMMFTFHDNIDNEYYDDIYTYIMSLCLDAMSIEGLTYEDWVEINNYDMSDPKTLKLYKRIKNYGERLYNFFTKAELKILFIETANF